MAEQYLPLHTETLTTTPFLVFLSGRTRGQYSALNGPMLEVVDLGDRQVDIIEPNCSQDYTWIIRFHRSDKQYELEANPNVHAWLNGEITQSRLLVDGDLIELENPPILMRIRYLRNDIHHDLTLAGMLNSPDNQSRKPATIHYAALFKRTINCARELSSRSSLAFRTSVIIALTLTSTVMISLVNQSSKLDERILTGEAKISGISQWVRDIEPNITHKDTLNEIQSKLLSDLAEATDRVSVLEEKSTSLIKVIGDTNKSVVFLLGEYTYEEKESGKKLRYVVNDDGDYYVNSLGHKLFDIEGTGDVHTIGFSGTAFVVSEDGKLLTNKHVATPWKNEKMLGLMNERGIFPVIERFMGYFPEQPEPFNVSPLLFSDTVDLAILQHSGNTTITHPIKLSSDLTQAGDEVLVMGYPTGLQALLARVEPELIEKIKAENDEINSWIIAEHLSNSGYIQPLSSRGIVGQVGSTMIAYDAETTSGGSGGPVLNSKGELIAVNTAIFPGFGGSNMGVSIDHVKHLLALSEAL